jgi:hypothetical protein
MKTRTAVLSLLMLSSAVSAQSPDPSYVHTKQYSVHRTGARLFTVPPGYTVTQATGRPGQRGHGGPGECLRVPRRSFLVTQDSFSFLINP